MVGTPSSSAAVLRMPYSCQLIAGEQGVVAGAEESQPEMAVIRAINIGLGPGPLESLGRHVTVRPGDVRPLVVAEMQAWGRVRTQRVDRRFDEGVFDHLRRRAGDRGVGE